jgi:hypothetical protein
LQVPLSNVLSAQASWKAAVLERGGATVDKQGHSVSGHGTVTARGSGGLPLRRNDKLTITVPYRFRVLPALEYLGTFFEFPPLGNLHDVC